MKNEATLSEIAIASRLASKKQFFVRSNSERIKALHCAKFLDLKIATRQRDDKSGWDIVPIK